VFDTISTFWLAQLISLSSSCCPSPRACGGCVLKVACSVELDLSLQRFLGEAF